MAHTSLAALSPTAVIPAASAEATYAVRLATTGAERKAAYRLRFRVFNLELNEGLEAAYETGYDTDPFDDVCEHLIVEDTRSGNVIGTYRMQTGASAAKNIGYYSASEFDFRPFEKIRNELLELGRACVDREHRSFEVISSLWRGIADYAVNQGCRYLIGCSSLTSQDEGYGAAMYDKLLSCLAGPEFRTTPLPSFACSLDNAYNGSVSPPKLLRTYLAIGAKICGAPAIDRSFKTIDFLTLLDLHQLAPSARQRYLGF